ncbi:cytochrome ubiquinol oxidase subunit I [bacterium]|nr:cytochrome ubiquinol oxidase subunit I [bacterium]
MSELFFARAQMGLSLAFHIVFAAIGVAMPLLMVTAEVLWLRTRERVYLELAHRWAKGTAIFFAVGAVSGTVLSFELGLLWPRFMKDAGAIIGFPFALEGFAFFTEAIFLGIYLYGWDRVGEKAHVLAGALVALSGQASAVFVLTANAWMNAPTGFHLEAGKLVLDDPIAAMFNRAALHECLHMGLASYAATGFGVASIHARRLLQDPENLFHRRAVSIALAIGGAAALLLPPSGHFSATRVAELQPAKLAAAEGQFQTERGAPLRIGGFPDRAAHRTRFAIEIPRMLSFLAYEDMDAVVKGLDDFPEDARPDPLLVHLAFQVMVGIGSALALVAVWATLEKIRKRTLAGSRWLLRAIVVSGPLAFGAVEAGWMVTELGRQPWVIYGVLKVRDAVTPVPGLGVELVVFSLLYLALAAVVVLLLHRQVAQSPVFHEGEEPAGA